MSFGNFGYGGNAGGFQQSGSRKAFAGQPSSLEFQSSPTFSQKMSATSASFDTGRTQAAEAYNPFAGRASGTYVSPVNPMTATTGRQISLMA